ncbi:hypothetical protein TSMEX_008624 [Taenia solium]|eukprot:TsM_001108000 transcript=TsM_001108000 gene=TsM_001108000
MTISMNLGESDRSQSSSPSLSCSNSSSKHAEHLCAPSIRAGDSGSAFPSKEGTGESAGEYSDDFESSSDDEAYERSTSLSNAFKGCVLTWIPRGTLPASVVNGQDLDADVTACHQARAVEAWKISETRDGSSCGYL